MKILFITSEAVPFSKTGGLADVCGALPKALHSKRHDIRIFTPYYRCVQQFPEISPQSKASLSLKLADKNVASILLEAAYPGLKSQRKLPVYFLKNDFYFDREELYGSKEGAYQDNAERFLYFSRAALEYVKKLDFRPDIVHVHDWHSAMVPVYLKSIYSDDPFFQKTASVLTIHNLIHQGSFWVYDMPLTGLGWEYFTPEWVEFYGYINFLKGGIMAADAITTVSPTYAREIQTPRHGQGLEKVLAWHNQKITGIQNGLDNAVWNPKTDPYPAKKYSAATLNNKIFNKEALQRRVGLPAGSRIPLLGMVSRLDKQKGLSLLVPALEKLLADKNFQVVIQGKGDQCYQDDLQELAGRYPDKLAVRFIFDEDLAHNIYAGSDFFLMPSLFEPGGLSQLISLRYGTIPIVRKTGGLADTIFDLDKFARKGNGLVFEDYSDSGDLADAIQRALILYSQPDKRLTVIKRCMKQDHSWENSSRDYLKLYKNLLKQK